MSTLRYLGKLELKVMDLEKIHGEINDIYAAGAVEGYSEQRAGFKACFLSGLYTILVACTHRSWLPNLFRQEKDLRELYKKAMKTSGPKRASPADLC